MGTELKANIRQGAAQQAKDSGTGAESQMSLTDPNVDKAEKLAAEEHAKAAREDAMALAKKAAGIAKAAAAEMDHGKKMTLDRAAMEANARAEDADARATAAEGYAAQGPASIEGLVAMTKMGKTSHMHPATVDAHKAAGWEVKSQCQKGPPS